VASLMAHGVARRKQLRKISDHSDKYVVQAALNLQLDFL
jgi:hypothetical protein